MSKVLVIPDVHLKPIMFERAAKILDSGQADFAVQLGDIFDDWGQEFNYRLYDMTTDKAIEFHKKYPKTLWCMGNHDFGYYFPEYGRRETGHSKMQEDTMADNAARMVGAGIEQKTIHVVDNVIFSHAGLTRKWAEKIKVNWDELTKYGKMTLDELNDHVIEDQINAVSDLDLLWEENSPFWARPQQHADEIMFTDKMQVVGHTPMKNITFENNILSTDVFSTHSNGALIGSRRFVIVDTVRQRFWLGNEGEIRVNL